MKAPQNLVITATAVFLAAGCSATHHAQDVRAADDTDRITVGTVQKEITLGMSAADVAAVFIRAAIGITGNKVGDQITDDAGYFHHIKTGFNASFSRINVL